MKGCRLPDSRLGPEDCALFIHGRFYSGRKQVTKIGRAEASAKSRGMVGQMGKRWVWLGIAVVLCAAVFVAACGSTSTVSSRGLTVTTAVVETTAATDATTTTTTATAASVQPPAGWVKYAGHGVELYLPPAFDLNVLDAKTRESIAALGTEAAKWVKGMEALDLSKFAVFVGDSASVASGSLTNVCVNGQAAESEITLKEFVDAQIPELAYHIVSRTDNLRLNGQEATRMVLDHGNISELMYLVKGPSGFWAVAYTTTTAEFQARLPDFEKSAATFSIGS